MRTKFYYLILVLFVCVFLVACYKNVDKVEEFQAGDIKDDFCGVEIDFRYCKCAFHNEFCDVINMSRKEADKYVRAEYEKWVDSEEEAFAKSCQAGGGYWDPGPGSCVYCPIGTAFSEKANGCVALSEEEEEEAKKTGEEAKEADEEIEEEEEEEKSQSQEDCDQGYCFVNGQCLPMNVECKGGAFMKPWGEVCALAAQYEDGQPLSIDICYCHGNFCYMDQQCKEMEVDRYCGDPLQAKIVNPAALCRYWQRADIDDTEYVWSNFCGCQPGYCQVVVGSKGDCEERPQVEQWCDEEGMHPKSETEVCAAVQRKAEDKHVFIFDWCGCDQGYDEDWEKERCVKRGE